MTVYLTAGHVRECACPDGLEREGAGEATSDWWGDEEAVACSHESGKGAGGTGHGRPGQLARCGDEEEGVEQASTQRSVVLAREARRGEPAGQAGRLAGWQVGMLTGGLGEGSY